MPDSALEATERQFRTLLSEAAEGIALRLSLFAIPEVPRSEKARRRMASSYSNIDELWDNRLDGLIVTGAEPVAARPNRRAILEQHGALDRVGGAQHLFHPSGVAWPRRPPCCGMSGIGAVHSAINFSESLSALRQSDHPLTAGVPSQCSDAAFPLERHTRGCIVRLRLPRTYAIGKWGRRRFRKAREKSVRFLPRAIRNMKPPLCYSNTKRHSTLPQSGKGIVPFHAARVFR